MKSTITAQLAKNIREVYFGKNWTCSNLKDNLADVTWEESNAQVSSLNTIIGLTYHIHYYVGSIMGVLDGGPLEGKDKYSFDHPPIESKEDWDAFLTKTYAEVEALALKVEQLDESTLWETFFEEKYGTYYRNIQGFIEHTHYHLGQIVVIKKMLRAKS